MTIPAPLATVLMWVAVIGTIGLGYTQGWPPIPSAIGLAIVVVVLQRLSE